MAFATRSRVGLGRAKMLPGRLGERLSRPEQLYLNRGLAQSGYLGQVC
jgi:hypothetical protein